MKPSCWYVLKHGDKYLSRRGWERWSGQRHAEQFVSRRRAKALRFMYSRDANIRVVLVHARIPEPKLPSWMCRADLKLKPRQFAVFSVGGARVWEYIFMVAPSGSFFCVDSVSHGAGGAEHCGPPASWKPEVITEAAARAAKWLRDERRGKK